MPTNSISKVSSAAAATQGSSRGPIRLDAIEVIGRIQKPQAFYVLQRSSLGVEELDLKENFLPRILQSVKKKPF